MSHTDAQYSFEEIAPLILDSPGHFVDGRGFGQVRGGLQSFRQCPVVQFIQLPPINGEGRQGGGSLGPRATLRVLQTPEILKILNFYGDFSYLSI